MTGDLMVSSLQKQTKKLKDDCLTYLKSLKSYDKIEDRDALIAVMETLNEVKSRNAEISLLVEQRGVLSTSRRRRCPSRRW